MNRPVNVFAVFFWILFVAFSILIMFDRIELTVMKGIILLLFFIVAAFGSMSGMQRNKS